MFSLRLRFLTLFCFTVAILSGSGDALNRSDLNSAMNTCCKIGKKLKICTENELDQSSNIPPIGICRSTMKLCCLIAQKNQICDKDFIVTSFDRFCGQSSGKYETCCSACKIGEQLAVESKVCATAGFTRFKALTNELVLDIISECCDRKKRQISNSIPQKTCRSGFFYNRTTNFCQDIDECKIENNGCEQSQDCWNSVGSYSCAPRQICKNGFKFDAEMLTCTKETDCTLMVTANITERRFVDADSATMESKPDKIVSTIRLFDALKQASCGSGFKFDQKTQTCVDINECEATKPCGESNSKCVNTVGSYTCECFPGYHLENQKCVDIDECRVDRRVCDHFCQNVEGSFKCHCRRGFRLNNATKTNCVDINECADNRNRCSHDCKNVKGSFRCGCPRGFILGVDKRTCEDVNECVENRGACESKVCNNLVGSYACYEPECPAGFKVYHFKGRNDFNKCVRKPCLNHDSTCLSKPKYLTFKNVTLGANMKIPKSGIVLHNVQIAQYRTLRLKVPIKFDYDLEIVRKDFLVQAAKASNFKIIKQETRALVVLTKSLDGPQDIKLIMKIRKGTESVVEAVTIDVNIKKKF